MAELRLGEVTGWRVSRGLDGPELILDRKYSRDVYPLTPAQARELAAALQAILPERDGPGSAGAAPAA